MKRGFTAHAHVHRLLSQFNHWSQEALESNPLKLPTFRILRLASNIPGLEYDRMPPLHQDNDITTSIREASDAVDNARHVKRTTLHGQTCTKKHDKIVRQQCKPIQYHKKLLKHLALLWELGLHNWDSLLKIQRHANEDYTLHIQPTSVIMVRLPNGDKPGPKTSLRTSLDTLRATLLLPTSTEFRKLPSDTTLLLTTMHASWRQFTTPDNLPPHTTNFYPNLMKPSIPTAYTNSGPATHISDALPTLDATNPAPLHIMEINDHRTLLHKTIYHVNQSKKTTLQEIIFASTFTTASHQNTLLACARKTRTLPYLPSPSKSYGKLHGYRKTLSDPSPTATQHPNLQNQQTAH
jgi:hypothetical protein